LKLLPLIDAALSGFHWHRSTVKGGAWSGPWQWETCACGHLRKTEWTKPGRAGYRGAGDVVWSSAWGTSVQVRDRELERYVD
jgi:hypothetical protein